MDDLRQHMRRRLFWERYYPEAAGENDRFLDALKTRIAEYGVGTVFMISSEDVDADKYLSLVGMLESLGMRVRNIHLSLAEESLFTGMVKVLDEIVGKFTSESCLVLSYGRSLAPLLVACYNVRAGESPSKAINRVRAIDDACLRNTEEKLFVYTFGKRIHPNDGDREMNTEDLLPWSDE